MTPASSRPRAASEVLPVIGELLRTCVHPKTITLQIESVSRQIISDSEDSEGQKRRKHATKLFLTDGELLIQAVLHRKLSTLPEIAHLDVGDVVEIHDFVVRRAQRLKGKGHVIYLGINSCYIIKAEDYRWSFETGLSASTTITNTKITEQADPDRSIEQEMPGGFCRDDVKANEAGGRQSMKGDTRPTAKHIEANLRFHSNTIPKQLIEPNLGNNDQNMSAIPDASRHTALQETHSFSHTNSLKRKAVCLDTSESDNEEAFETANINVYVAKKRRQVLRELSQNTHSSPSRPPTCEAGNLPVTDVQDFSENKSRQSIVRFDLSELNRGDGEVTKASSAVHSHQYQKLSDLDAKDSFPMANMNSYRALAPQDTIISGPIMPTHTIPNPHAWGSFHNLVSLYTPSLPSKSYIFTTLVIPTYVSSHLVSRPNSPFPPKRHIKVIDPSLASKLGVNTTNILGKGFTVSVYRDAINFKPVVGKVALMRGAVMQRLSGAMKNSNRNNEASGSTSTGEIILNVYPENSRIQRQSQSQQQSQVQAQNGDKAGDKPTGNKDTSTIISQHQSTHNKAEISRESEAKVSAKRPHGFHNQSERPFKRSTNSHSHKSTSGLYSDLTFWFIDDPKLLRKLGYDVDGMQKWWNSLR